eukprot:CAMPEP_0113618270 /NCGR_PEP_ID=MMETSP0017_2-20120614/9243_1 /TAXON_ID=2856 /ORGANISM="Cylindrotheca closterium" /LENGTH=1121 /DNA_ID=CAMNT_0000527759 /DNA_START=13 /DNA_END=3378 /DNA_ORIENTATION=+ /assembly_acc=CAM_ASM_000147
MSLASPLLAPANAAKAEAATATAETYNSSTILSAPSAVNIDRSLLDSDDETTAANNGGGKSKAKGYRASRIALSIVLEIVLLVIPFTLLTTAYVCQELYLGPFVAYLDSFRIMDKGADHRGYYYSLDQDVTYYHRHCTKEDITTFGINKTDRSNLLILPEENTTAEIAQDIMMTHGAVILPQVLTTETAINLRSYLESRHEIQDTLSWQEKFWTGINRLSLGLGFDDDPSIQQAIHEIGHNPMIEATLEGLFGEPDAAIVEISTLTSLHGAENQGLHSDSDFFGSSLLYGRTFLHSYTMFVALQDTTSRMGATTVCPGTHWCANPDMEEICLPFEYEYQEEDVQEAFDAYNENEAFDVSSNGITKKEGGVLLQGDAMMFNQNAFHRGPQNDDPTFKDTNRAMFIVTFVNKRDFEKYGDVRQQGMGTYYYQRWTMWGHSFSDFRHALSSKHSFWKQPWATLKALGITASKAVPWPEHVARQLANQMDFFMEDELPDFKAYMELIDGFVVPYVQQGTSSDDWHEYIPEVFGNFVEAGLYVYQCGLLAVLVIGLLLSPGGTRLSFVKRLLGFHLIIAGIGYGIFYGIQEYSFLGQKIVSNEIKVTPFGTSGIIPDATTLPDRLDYLVGSRYDADFLGSYNRALDYQPGNKALNQLVQEYGSSDLPLDCLANLIQEQWDTPRLSNPPRMLLQDAATGYWTVMKDAATFEYLQRLILRRQQPLIQYIDKYLLQAMADARFGRRRETAMAKYQTMALLEDLQGRFVSTLSLPKGETGRNVPASFLRSKSLLHPTSSTTAVGLRSPTKLLRPTSTPHYLSPGSRVWAASGTGAIWHGSWEAARVVEKLDNGLIKVVYDKDGMKQRSLAPMLVQPYYHLVQGDKVEFLYSYGGQTWDWREGEVDSVSPLGTYNVQTGGRVISRIGGDDIRARVLRQELQSGDVIWAAVSENGTPTGGWTKASIVETAEDKVLVKFDDSDLWEEKKLTDVQPYFTVEEGDFVEVRLHDGSWSGATIEAAFESTKDKNRKGDDSEDSEDESGDQDGMGKRDFDVYVHQYDEELEGVEEHEIRPLLPLLAVGARVLANYADEGTWFPGTVDEVNSYHRTYNVKYDDGDFETHVIRDRLQVQS